MPVAPRLTPDRWRQIEDVFHRASQLASGSRSAFLQETCGTDSDLRREVESLLASLSDEEPFLEEAVQGAAEACLGDLSARTLAKGAYLGQYRIIRMLGAGSMGEVYLAEDTRLERKVALKMLASHLTRDPHALWRFAQEARVLSGLNHANLLTVFDFRQFEGRHFLVTEFIEGTTLREVLNQGRVERARALDIATQVAAALAVAHASGVIHRDIKPENIAIRTDGWVKVLDFGIAKLTERPSAEKQSDPGTVPGAILGTPRYMSPEQARGTGVDERSDLFSLGGVLYEMLAGRAPFEGSTWSDQLADILRGTPTPLNRCVPGIPKALQTTVERALEKDSALRYQSAESLLQDLRKCRQDAESTRHPRTILLTVATTLALVIAVAAGVLAWREWAHGKAPESPRSLAVLPFRNLRPDPSTDFLGISLADEVTSKLGYVKALTVRPPEAVSRYRDGAPDLRKAAADLNTRMLLTGTYLRDGDDLRITARLIGFNPETVLWQNTLDVKYEKLLTVQDRVAEMIIGGLALRPGPDEKMRLAAHAPVNNLAYEYYLRGVDLYAASDFSGAITMLEKAVSIDATYAPTWAFLGRAYTTNGSLQFGGRDNYRKAEQAYEKAIALNPEFPDPRVYMANLLTDTGRVEEAVPLVRMALQSSPNNAEAHWELGYAYRHGGMLAESAAECLLARRLDPEVKINSSALNTWLYLGEYDQFLNSMPANDSPLLIFYHGFGSYYKGNYGESEADFERAYELAPELLPAQVGEALREGLRHRETQGLSLLGQTELRMTLRGVTDPEAMYKIAQAYAVLGDRVSALRMLQRSLTGGFFCFTYIQSDPLLRSLQGSTVFGSLLGQAKQRQEQFQRRFGR